MRVIECNCDELGKCDVEIDKNLFKITDFKECIYCSCYFNKIDFPQTFDRQLTCGCVSCQGIRRKELFKKRMDRIKKEMVVIKREKEVENG